MQYNRSPWSPVQAFVTVHMQDTMAEDHGSSVSSASGRDLKTGPSQGAFKAVSRAHAPGERQCRWCESPSPAPPQNVSFQLKPFNFISVI